MAPARVALLLTFAGLAALIHGVNRGAWQGAYSGDEPHYLMVVNSLLNDHDLELQDDYRRVARGSWDAGRRFRYAPLDHHTVLVDRSTGESRLWQEVFDWRVRECREPGCEGYRRLTQDFLPGQPRSEVSAHPVTFPALIALALLPFQPRPENVEPAANRVMQLLCWLGAVLTFLAARAAGLPQRSALIASVLLAVASPWLAYSRSLFVELPAGVALIAGVLALQKGHPRLAGVAAGVAFAFKPPFLFFGLGWMVERLLAGRRRDAVELGAAIAGVGLLLGVFNQVTARRWVVSGTSSWKWTWLLDGLHGNLFDGAHGLLPFVPWAMLAFLALALAVRADSPGASLGRQVAFPLVPYVGMIAANAYLGETCYGPRYWVAVLPLLALGAVELLRQLPARREARLGLALLGLLGAYVAVPGALRYPDLWDRPALAAWQPR